jgi:predicted alpha/beta-hydrolase family hydrolase
VVRELRRRSLRGVPLLVGGRSSGARVACRTASEVGAAGVLCLAFPLQPPAARPSRLPELDAVEIPVLVVQGERDRFGIPPAAPPDREVVVVRGDHSLRSDRAAVADAVRTWIAHVLPR